MAGRKPNPAETPEAGPTFEEALERLETIVEQLEGGELSLEQSIASYEEGVKLSRRLGATHDKAEKRIERMVAGEEGGTPTTERADRHVRAAETPPARAPRAPAKPSFDEGQLPF